MDMLNHQKLLKKSGEVVNANEALRDKKIICYYFSAHWCPPCLNFTPILCDFYNVSLICFTGKLTAVYTV